MSEPDSFLNRWSRRKREARREEPRTIGPELPAEAEPEPPVPELPPVESITAETDISVFLAKGVADSVRNAALRRMWSLDPAIRDYVGDARDYAYDWNTPGGVPGFGAIEPSYDIEGTIARMFSGPEEREDEAAGEKPVEIAAGPSQDEEAPSDRGEGALTHEPQTEAEGSQGRDAQTPSPPEAEEPARVNTPRHGRAKPV